MNIETIYDKKTEGEPFKLNPKSEYSSDYRERKTIRMVAYCRVSTDKKSKKPVLRFNRSIIKIIFLVKKIGSMPEFIQTKPRELASNVARVFN